MTSASAEHLTDDNIGGIALILQLLASRVETLIVQNRTAIFDKPTKNKKKTPRPKARRKV